MHKKALETNEEMHVRKCQIIYKFCHSEVGSRNASTRLDDMKEEEEYDRPRPTPRSCKANIMDRDDYDKYESVVL